MDDKNLSFFKKVIVPEAGEIMRDIMGRNGSSAITVDYGIVEHQIFSHAISTDYLTAMENPTVVAYLTARKFNSGK